MAEVRTVAWERSDGGLGHSLARMAPTDDGWLFHGSEILVSSGVRLACGFRVLLDQDFVTREVAVRGFDATGERSLRLTADADRRWFVDGSERPDLVGCLDVDIAATPLTNTFPIRRLAALAVGGTATLAVAWVDVPELGVTRVEQTYRRLEPVGEHSSWEYSDPAHGAFTLTVDGDGLVVDYQGFARRVAAG